MSRVVLDTNILISAFITPGGRGDEAVKAVLSGRAEMFTSIPMLTELAGKLTGKFGWEREKALDAVQFAASLATVVSPRRKISLLKDEPDNRVLECAVEAGADLIVTGDRHLLDIGRYETAQVVTLTGFLKSI
jgi:putative PIN family toxin of toxin-antitoxin system